MAGSNDSGEYGGSKFGAIEWGQADPFAGQPRHTVFRSIGTQAGPDLKGSTGRARGIEPRRGTGTQAGAIILKSTGKAR